MNTIGHVKSTIPTPHYVGSHAGKGLNKNGLPTAPSTRVVYSPPVKQAGYLTGTGVVQRATFGKATHNGIPPLQPGQ